MISGVSRSESEWSLQSFYESCRHRIYRCRKKSSQIDQATTLAILLLCRLRPKGVVSAEP